MSDRRPIYPVIVPMLFGPVFQSELVMTARRKRYYLARVLYGFFLLFSLWQQYREFISRPRYHFWRGYAAESLAAASIKLMALFAESAFVAFAWAQGAALLFLVPALLAGVIADEHQRKTLHYLLGSRLSSFEIVIGKLLARLLHVGVVLLIGVPVVCLVALFGGLDPSEVAIVYAGTLSMTLFVAGLSMLVSVVARRPRQAILLAYVLEAAWLFLPPLISSIETYLEARFAWIKPINDVVILTNPVQTWRLVTDQSFKVQGSIAYSGSSGAVVRGIVGGGQLERFLAMAVLQALLGTIFLLLAIVGLRPLRGGGGRWERRQTVWFPTLRAWGEKLRTRPDCNDAPMLWKEQFAAGGGGLGWLSSRPVVFSFALVLGAYLLTAAEPAAGEFARASQGGFGVSDRNRISLNESLRMTGACLYVLLLLSVASASAVSVVSEREQDTWTSLTASLLTGPEVMLGKIRGALWSARRIVWVLAAMWLLGAVAGAVHPLGVLAEALGLAVFSWFTAALGVYISLRAKNSTRALATTLIWLLILNAGYLVLVLPFVDTGSPMYVSGSTPWVEFCALLSYRDVNLILFNQPSAPEGAPHVFGQFRFDVIGMYVIAVTFYGIGALLVTGAACDAYETVVDRPRRQR